MSGKSPKQRGGRPSGKGGGIAVPKLDEMSYEQMAIAETPFSTFVADKRGGAPTGLAARIASARIS